MTQHRFDDLREYKVAYNEALKQYPLPNKLLAQLHRVSESAIDKWRYVADRYPDFRAVFELYLFYKSLDVAVPEDLAKLVNRSRNRAFDLKLLLDESPITGEKIKVKRNRTSKKLRFLLNNESVDINDLMTKTGYSRSYIYAKIKKAGIEDGEEIAHLGWSSKP